MNLKDLVNRLIRAEEMTPEEKEFFTKHDGKIVDGRLSFTLWPSTKPVEPLPHRT